MVGCCGQEGMEVESIAPSQVGFSSRLFTASKC